MEQLVIDKNKHYYIASRHYVFYHGEESEYYNIEFAAAHTGEEVIDLICIALQDAEDLTIKLNTHPYYIIETEWSGKKSKTNTYTIIAIKCLD